MNEVQKKLLEIATEYIRVCRLLNLRYFAIGGTLIGAIRHGGFIPWDDDIDFAMPREDYNLLIRKGKNMFSKKYFLQNYVTEKDYCLSFTKIRDSSTTAIENHFKNDRINHGLWIDIFPMERLAEKFV